MNTILVKRMLIGIGLIIVLFGGYKILEYISLDPDTGNIDSTDMITAVEYTENGSQIVLFDADGKKTVIPGAEPGVNDKDPVWRPDGQRVFFVSDRDNQPYNIFRWNPAKEKVEQRSSGSQSKSSPYFGPPDWPGLKDSALIISRGTVLEFNQRLQRTWQKLPPRRFQDTESADAQSAFEAMYGRIGSSIKSAMWGTGRRVMYTVLRRSGGDIDNEKDMRSPGEVFIVNFMENMGEHRAGPEQMFAAESIEFDVGSDGTAVVSVRGFQFIDPSRIPPEVIRDGVAYNPYTNATFVVSVTEEGTIEMFPLHIAKADLGIQPGDDNPGHRAEHGIPEQLKGVIVENVEPGFAADTMGMKQGDLIMSINGHDTSDIRSMEEALWQILMGEEVKIRYYSTGDDAEERETTYAFGQEPSMYLSDLAISPDTTMVACVLGFIERGINFDSRNLVLIPLREGGMAQSRPLIRGTVFEPSWHPDGKSLVYAKSGPAGDSQLFTINADGSNEKLIYGVGDYGQPSFSPIIGN